MKFLSLSVLAAVSLLAGCAATPGETESSADEVTARPVITLTDTDAAGSIQEKLFTLLDTFRNDRDLGIASGIDSAALILVGAPEADVSGRSLGCHRSTMELVAPGGGGFSVRHFYGCSLTGFDRVRSGGILPRVSLHGDAKPLAEQLYKLLQKGHEKGNLGVERDGDDPNGKTECCDMMSSTTYTVAAGRAKLSCNLTAGGIAGIVEAKCEYLVEPLPFE